MKRILLAGRSGCGKTTLMQRLQQQPIAYKKTQTVEISGSVIDTPGEYMEHKKMFCALVVTCADAQLAVLVQDATDTYSTFFPGMQTILNMPVVGVISKSDLASPEEMERARTVLEMAGAEKIFSVSAYTGQGLAALLVYLEEA